VPEFLLALVDERNGNFLVESTDSDIASEFETDLADMLGDPEGLACARPQSMETIEPVDPVAAAIAAAPMARISGYWHDSVIEGPGYRSAVRFQGCPIHCPGCYVVETWAFEGGQMVYVESLAEALLEPDHQRDGITFVGGEPFAQAGALAELIRQLRARQPDIHLLSYTGYTLEALRRRNDPDTDYALDHLDTLIDGPYIEKLHSTAGPWTGSGNQRVIDMRATRERGEVVLSEDV
jgi:anaerobic ribonucleoside-triphosphate reductase activating protein